MSTFWLFTIEADGARLITIEPAESRTKSKKVSSPVVKASTVLSLVVKHLQNDGASKLVSDDAKSAFPKTPVMDKRNYRLRTPKGFEMHSNDNYVTIHKKVYGLKSSPLVSTGTRTL